MLRVTMLPLLASRTVGVGAVVHPVTVATDVAESGAMSVNVPVVWLNPEIAPELPMRIRQVPAVAMQKGILAFGPMNDAVPVGPRLKCGEARAVPCMPNSDITPESLATTYDVYAEVPPLVFCI
jgi:hypothetical protein